MKFKIKIERTNNIAKNKVLLELIHHKANKPNRTHPIKDETFSSFLIRHCIASGQNLRILLRISGIPQISFDIDYRYNKKVVELVAKRTKLDKNYLKSQILLSEYKKVQQLKYWKKTSCKKNYWHTHNNWRNERDILNGQRYCPLCFREDKQPYYRKQWKRNYMSFCPKHLCLLENKCPNCKTPQSFVALHFESDLDYCSRCFYSLHERNIRFVKHYGVALEIYSELINSDPINYDFIKWMLILTFFFSKHTSFPIIEEFTGLSIKEIYEDSNQKKLDKNKIRLHLFDDIELFFHFFTYSLLLFKYLIKDLWEFKKLYNNYILKQDLYSSNKIYICPTCHYQSSHIDEILIHYFRDQNQMKNPAFVCDVCNKKYAFKKDLEIHHTIHEDPKYICMYCESRPEFATKAGLDDHLRIHQDHF